MVAGAGRALEALLESAGLTTERALELPAPFVYPDIATAQRANLAAGPIRMAINQVGLDAVRATLAEALPQFVQTGGSVRVENVYRMVIGDCLMPLAGAFGALRRSGMPRTAPVRARLLAGVAFSSVIA